MAAVFSYISRILKRTHSASPQAAAHSTRSQVPQKVLRPFVYSVSELTQYAETKKSFRVLYKMSWLLLVLLVVEQVPFIEAHSVSLTPTFCAGSVAFPLRMTAQSPRYEILNKDTAAFIAQDDASEVYCTGFEHALPEGTSVTFATLRIPVSEIRQAVSASDSTQVPLDIVPAGNESASGTQAEVIDAATSTKISDTSADSAVLVTPEVQPAEFPVAPREALIVPRESAASEVVPQPVSAPAEQSIQVPADTPQSFNLFKKIFTPAYAEELPPVEIDPVTSTDGIGRVEVREGVASSSHSVSSATVADMPADSNVTTTEEVVTSPYRIEIATSGGEYLPLGYVSIQDISRGFTEFDVMGTLASTSLSELEGIQVRITAVRTIDGHPDFFMGKPVLEIHYEEDNARKEPPLLISDSLPSLYTFTDLVVHSDTAQIAILKTGSSSDVLTIRALNLPANVVIVDNVTRAYVLYTTITESSPIAIAPETLGTSTKRIYVSSENMCDHVSEETSADTCVRVDTIPDSALVTVRLREDGVALVKQATSTVGQVNASSTPEVLPPEHTPQTDE